MGNEIYLHWVHLACGKEEEKGRETRLVRLRQPRKQNSMKAVVSLLDSLSACNSPHV